MPDQASYLTPRQHAVLEVFQQQKRPITVKEAWRHAGMDEMSQATVYRAVAKLIGAGQLRPIEINGAPPRYEAVSAQQHQHYFFCRTCGTVYDVPHCVKGLSDMVPNGFRMTDHSITLYGECTDCLNE